MQFPNGVLCADSFLRGSAEREPRGATKGSPYRVQPKSNVRARDGYIEGKVGIDEMSASFLPNQGRRVRIVGGGQTLGLIACLLTSGIV